RPSEMQACKDIRGRINLYLDNELQRDDHLQFETHLRDCEAGSSRTRTQQRLLQSCREVKPLHVASTDLRDRVIESLNASTTVPVEVRRRMPNLTWSRLLRPARRAQ